MFSDKLLQRKWLRDALEDFPRKRLGAGNQVAPRSERERPAIHVVQDAAGLENEDCARADVPGLRAALVEPAVSPACDGARRGAEAARHADSAHATVHERRQCPREVLNEGVATVVPSIRRDDRIGQRRRGLVDGDAGAVEEGAAVATGLEELVAARVVDDAEHGLLVDGEADGYCDLPVV
jgi:hypothetical protein